jgi:hypothetical protein
VDLLDLVHLVLSSFHVESLFRPVLRTLGFAFGLTFAEAHLSIVDIGRT